jgi:MFS family permease
VKIKEYINKVIFFLTISDIFTWGTIAMGTPLIGIFLSKKFGDQTILYVGIATACYFISRAIVQIPIGLISDKIHHDNDEILILFLGCFIMGIGYILIPFITEPWQYFLIMSFIGLGASMNLNSWRKLFSSNLDKTHEGVGYGFYETIMSFSTAIISLIGGYFSSLSNVAFEIVLITIGFAIIIGGLISGSILLIKNRKSKNV